MEDRASIRFTLNGQRYELRREDVESRLQGVAPDAIRKHAVRVSGTCFPVIQAFETATGIPRSEFMSNTARRHLAALGYEIAGDVESRTPAPAEPPPFDVDQFEHACSFTECSYWTAWTGCRNWVLRMMPMLARAELRQVVFNVVRGVVTQVGG